MFLAPWSRSRLKKKQEPEPEPLGEKNQEPEPLEKKNRSRKKICRLPSPVYSSYKNTTTLKVYIFLLHFVSTYYISLGNNY